MCNEEQPPYLTPTGHQQLIVEVTQAMRRTHPTLIPISHQQLRVEVTRTMRKTHPALLPFPISHQQLIVEVTWAMRRTHPTLPPISHQQLTVEVTWAMRKAHSTLLPISHYTAVLTYWDPRGLVSSISAILCRSIMATAEKNLLKSYINLWHPTIIL